MTPKSCATDATNTTQHPICWGQRHSPARCHQSRVPGCYRGASGSSPPLGAGNCSKSSRERQGEPEDTTLPQAAPQPTACSDGWESPGLELSSASPDSEGHSCHIPSHFGSFLCFLPLSNLLGPENLGFRRGPTDSLCSQLGSPIHPCGSRPGLKDHNGSETKFTHRQEEPVERDEGATGSRAQDSDGLMSPRLQGSLPPTLSQATQHTEKQGLRYCPG